MKKVVANFLKYIGRFFGIDLHDENVVLDLNKKFEIDKIVSEKEAMDKLKETCEERNMATRQLNRSQKDYQNSLLERQKIEKELDKCRNGNAAVLWQDEGLENSLGDLKPVKERLTDVTIKFCKINKAAITPTKFNKNDAGYDLYCPTDSPIIVPPRDRVVVDTGIAMSIPRGYYGRITTRASISWRDGIGVLSGIIDAGNNNTVKIILHNSTNEPKNFLAGSRLAQIVVEKAETVTWEEKTSLSNSEKKVGSTGD